jgi:uncharacterized phage protein (TIGR02218 family)
VTARTLPANIEAQRASGFIQLAWALEIEPQVGGGTDSDGNELPGTPLRYCGTSRNQTIDGDLYTAVPGMSVSSIASTLGLQVDNCKASVGDNGDVVAADVLDGVWDGAKYRLFLFYPGNPDPSEIVPWHYGIAANVEPRVGAFDFELRDWRQLLQQDVTRTHQYGCPYELGDENCAKDLTAFTFADVPVTAVGSTIQITASSLAQAADFFTNGRLRFSTGANANGIWRQIKDHNTGGVLQFVVPLVYAVSIGDEFEIIAGCTHRPDEDCRDKFANKLRYGGCDTKPPANDILTGALAE